MICTVVLLPHKSRLTRNMGILYLPNLLLFRQEGKRKDSVPMWGKSVEKSQTVHAVLCKM